MRDGKQHTCFWVVPSFVLCSVLQGRMVPPRFRGGVKQIMSCRVRDRQQLLTMKKHCAAEKVVVMREMAQMFGAAPWPSIKMILGAPS